MTILIVEMIFILLAGVAIGMIYFCSLKYSLSTSKRLCGWSKISVFLRLIILGVVVVLMMQGSSLKALICLLGIILGRNFLIREVCRRGVWN